MDKIPSFTIDHEVLEPGVYISRIDTVGSEKVTTFDIRMKRPNREPVVHQNAMHTIEHIIATYLRNDPQWKDSIIYWGPMGCLTGSYLVVKGCPKPEEIAALMLKAFEFLKNFEGEIPGADSKSCGNYLLHDLNMAKYEAALYIDALKNRPSYSYN